MKILELIRLEEDAKYGTFGILKIDKRVFCCTLEPPDRLNELRRSSVPPQQYLCHRIVNSKRVVTFEVRDVPGRSGIQFHAGNLVKDTEGCILLGQYFGKLRGDSAVMNSGETFRRFMGELAGENEVHLTVKEVF